ncbi:MAG: DEAD/DEAH box helicase family protein [Myxococcota bacterium]
MGALGLRFVQGTLEISGLAESDPPPLDARWDPRTQTYRLPAIAYADLIRAWVGQKQEYVDEARGYETLKLELFAHRELRPYQKEALEAWRSSRARGVVVLPTGAGKTYLAVLAILEKQRSTLVIAPTLDLVRQWYDVLRLAFQTEVGVIGGGEYRVAPLTVTTYDSAHLYAERLGNRFGLVIFDECHHLPAEAYSLAAEMCLAPFRLGLTATPERADGQERRLESLIGPSVLRRGVAELAGEWLAEYEVETLSIPLSPAERGEYDSEREIYRNYLRKSGIRIGSPQGFAEFIQRSAGSDEGRRAYGAYRRQRELALAASGKLEVLGELLRRHQQDQTLIFTEDNAMAYRIARQLLIPAITHQTKVSERSQILASFEQGALGAVVTSKVLNEGVDVPSANVAVIVSGSGSVREHVQRLGRILRKKEGKTAVLYELITEGTAESYIGERRRAHEAYSRPEGPE